MRSVNFITAHDGFTLNDLVSYDYKHNQANGEDNRDGNDQNDSWNCGIEGPTDDPQIEALRQRQIRNLFTILLTSQGQPMFLMGDEVRHTQQGNNNAYCQDNEISWFDWNQAETHTDLLDFVRGLLNFRQNSELYRDQRYWFERGGTDIHWHGVHLGQPDFGENSHSLAFELTHSEVQEHLYVLLNAYWEPLEFELPQLQENRSWARMIDTANPSPEDFIEPVEMLSENKNTYLAQSRSVIVLVECIAT